MKNVHLEKMRYILDLAQRWLDDHPEDKLDDGSLNLNLLIKCEDGGTFTLGGRD